ncbi:hypothetical protein [Streptomyces sp. NBC_01343]|uniref:hypothetical protein n=1 Tax=Streptomyces sp. NBC_01343 TaxID=2903832 RepID=UPI003FA3D823
MHLTIRTRGSDGRSDVSVVTGLSGIDPEREVLVADNVGIALLVVLETLAPAERLAFVLHDLFAVPFARFAAAAVPVLVNGIPGALAMAEGKPLSLMAFTVRNGKIVALDILTDPHRVAGISLDHTPDG